MTEEKTCYICSSAKFVDDHHYDCQEGALSPETVPLCRRCHRTYHDLGVEWFEDEYLDKAIEIENRRREIYNANLEYFEKERAARAAQFPWSPWLKKPITPLPLLKREDITRSNYFNKKHGIKKSKRPNHVDKGLLWCFPSGRPLCGWEWYEQHKTDYTIDDIESLGIVILVDGKETIFNRYEKGKVRQLVRSAP